ncbi:hypothetical protein VNI00_004276 [Paramarasmius palmivorus]|uniref:WW domain-containing protein n=1 Tax=Paramarasmius palmivorus TaxID=297713 RepID=A0AAW0DK94_9AGAR
MTSSSPSVSPSGSKESSPKPAEAEEIKAKEVTESPKPESESEEEAEKESDTSDTKSEKGEETTSTATATSSTPWQAIFSPQYNSYYFYNTETQETTWQNPLSASDASNAVAGPSSEAEPTASSSSSTTDTPEQSSSSSYSALQTAALAQGIDPALAYLDPTLASVPGTSSVGYGATARFNARTGQFARPDGRDPSHLSEFERMKRMSEFYFDVNAWEKQRAQEQEEEEVEGKKRKRPSKKDVERFKEQKRLKKIAKTAWLRT